MTSAKQPDAYHSSYHNNPTAHGGLYPDASNASRIASISLESLMHSQHADMLPGTAARALAAPEEPALSIFSPLSAAAVEQRSYHGDPNLWPGSPVGPFGHPYAAQLHAGPAEYHKGPESLATKISRSFRKPTRAEPQLLGGSPLESLYPSSYEEPALHPSHRYGAIELPAAAPLQLLGHSQLAQGSHDVLQMTSYSQPLRGTPIESLPAAQAAAYIVDLPAAAAPTSEAVLRHSSSPRTPTCRTLSAHANSKKLDQERLEVKVMETPDLELEAQWQGAALVGSPQLGSPWKVPKTPRQDPPVSSQEQALSFKRRKVEEELGGGQDHIYVVFSLPAPGSPAHRSRALPPGPWGADVQASGLMGLVGHTYLQTGPAKCQWLFSKCLTASDTNKLSRMILPRQAVETFLPYVEDRAGLDLDVWDTACFLWHFKLKFWLNGTNPKRMYVLENVRDFVQLHNLQAGSTLSFYYAPDNRLVFDTRPVEEYFDMTGEA